MTLYSTFKSPPVLLGTKLQVLQEVHQILLDLKLIFIGKKKKMCVKQNYDKFNFN